MAEPVGPGLGQVARIARLRGPWPPTSSGFAATLGRNDGSVTRDEALVNAAVIVAATDLPVIGGP